MIFNCAYADVEISRVVTIAVTLIALNMILSISGLKLRIQYYSHRAETRYFSMLFFIRNSAFLVEAG